MTGMSVTSARRLQPARSLLADRYSDLLLFRPSDATLLHLGVRPALAGVPLIVLPYISALPRHCAVAFKLPHPRLREPSCFASCTAY